MFRHTAGIVFAMRRGRSHRPRARTYYCVRNDLTGLQDGRCVRGAKRCLRSIEIHGQSLGPFPDGARVRAAYDGAVKGRATGVRRNGGIASGLRTAFAKATDLRRADLACCPPPAAMVWTDFFCGEATGWLAGDPIPEGRIDRRPHLRSVTAPTPAIGDGSADLAGIAQTTRELADLARGAGMRTLAYLLECAGTEAEHLLVAERKGRGEETDPAVRR